MKNLQFALGLLFASLAFGQTKPIYNAVLSGTVTLPSGATITASGSDTVFSQTSGQRFLFGNLMPNGNNLYFIGGLGEEWVAITLSTGIAFADGNLTIFTNGTAGNQGLDFTADPGGRFNFNSPTFFNSTIAIGGALNGLLYKNSAGNVAITAVGSAGQVLTSNGPGNAPTFQTGSGSGGISGATGNQILVATGATTGSSSSGLSTDGAGGFLQTGNHTFQTGGDGIVGDTSNNHASAGIVGELMGANLASGSATPVTSTVQGNVVSIALTAGHWLIWGNVFFHVVGAPTVSTWSAGISPTSATLGNLDSGLTTQNANIVAVASVDGGFPVPLIHVSTNAPHTYYLVYGVNFTGGTSISAYGGMTAFRTQY